SSATFAERKATFAATLLPGPLVLQRQPGAAGFAAGDGLLDEVHPFHAVVDVGVDGVRLLERLSFGPLDHGVVGSAVDVGEGFEEGFGVAAGEAAGPFAGVVHEGGVGIPREHPVGLAVGPDDHHVRLLLPPGEGPLGAVDFNEQVVFAAVADLRGGDRAESHVFELDDRGAVVVERAAGLEGLEVAANLVGEEAGHVAGQVVSVRGDVAEAAGRPALGRVGPPRGLLLVGELQPRPEPALDVAGPD